MSKTFGTLKESKYASEYTKNKGLKKCKTKINVNKSNLIINLYSKENLEGVNVLSISNTNGDILPCIPFYENYIIDPSGELFGNTSCGINNFTKYSELSIQKVIINTTIISGGYQIGSLWPHLGGLNNFNTRRSTNYGCISDSSYISYPPQILDSSFNYISSPVIDACGNVYSIFTNNINSYLFKLTNGIQKLIKEFHNEIIISTPAINFIGNLYICTIDKTNNNSYLYNISNIGNIVWKQRIGISKSCFSSPSIDSSGNIYIISTSLNRNFESSLYSINSNGLYNNKFNNGLPIDVSGISFSSTAIDSCNNILFTISDPYNPQSFLYSISPNGSFNNKFNSGLPFDVSGNTISSPSIDLCGNIYIISPIKNLNISRLYSITSDGSFNNNFNSGLPFDVSGNNSSSVVLDSCSNIYFSTYNDISNNSTLYSITANGSYNTDFSGGYIVISDTNTSLSTPAIDKFNNIYLNSIDDTYNNIFNGYTSKGVLIFKQTTIGTGLPFIFTSSPAIGNKTTYFGGNNGTFYEFKSK